MSNSTLCNLRVFGVSVVFTTDTENTEVATEKSRLEHH